MYLSDRKLMWIDSAQLLIVYVLFSYDGAER
jgi:hypothetical protein